MNANVIRVRGFAMACCADVLRARRELEAAVDVLETARGDAEQALRRLHDACDLGERMGTFAARAMAGDVEPDTLCAAATAIEELCK